MALPSTIYRFQIDVSDVDRNNYGSFEIRVAQHPSESDLYLVTRIIAYALHQADGVEFSRSGLCDPSDPPLLAQDLTGQMTMWIDIGQPSADRVHKAGKTADEVYIYTYKNPLHLMEAIAKADVHRADEIRCYSLEPDFLEPLGRDLTRNNKWTVVRTEGALFVETASGSHSGQLVPHQLG
jgi:uncharacterized protein YaeQ